MTELDALQQIDSEVRARRAHMVAIKLSHADIGKKAIEDWFTRTIEKYKFQFRPVTFRGDNAEVIVAIEVPGTSMEA
jgi:hypothetical protein